MMHVALLDVSSVVCILVDASRTRYLFYLLQPQGNREQTTNVYTVLRLYRVLRVYSVRLYTVQSHLARPTTPRAGWAYIAHKKLSNVHLDEWRARPAPLPPHRDAHPRSTSTSTTRKKTVYEREREIHLVNIEKATLKSLKGREGREVRTPLASTAPSTKTTKPSHHTRHSLARASE